MSLRAAGLAPLSLAVALAACVEPEPLSDTTAALEQRELGGFVPGELMVELDRDDVSGPIVLGGVALTPIGRQPSGVWRLAITGLETARTDALAERPTDADARAAAEAATSDALAAVRAAPGVRAAYLNLTLELSIAPNEPNDPLYWAFQQWNTSAIRLRDAWHLTTGHAGIRLAIIDSELATSQHPDLAAKWGPGRDFFTPDSGGNDAYHHGAHVAGIAGAQTNDGEGMAGVCWGCTLLPYRVSARLATHLAEVEQAVRFAAGDGFEPRRADVINLSMNRRLRGTSGLRMRCADNDVATENFAAELARAQARGVIVVVSAGNFGHETSQFHLGPAFPADCPGVISVAAIQPDGAVAPYSNRDGVTLAAPGGGENAGGSLFGASAPQQPCPASALDPYSGTAGVMSAWMHYVAQADATPADYCYRYLSGTSMSAPHVTGTIGLMLARNVNLGPAQVRDILQRTAQVTPGCPRVGPGAFDGPCGAGLLDAGAAVAFAPRGGVPVPSAPGLAFGTVAAGSSAVAAARVTNTGSATLAFGTLSIVDGAGQITFAFASGCTGGTSCATPPAPIAPGGFRDLPLRCTPTAGGTITATLVVATDGHPASLSVPISCTGSAPPEITVAPTVVSFDSTPVGGVASRDVLVRNDGGGTLSFSASESSPHFAFDCAAGCGCTNGVCTGNLAPGHQATLAVAFAPVAAGPQAAGLTITANDGDEPTTTVILLGTGTQPGIRLSPSPELHLGAVPVGQTRTDTVFVINTGTAPLRVTGAALASSSSVFAFAGTCDGQTSCPLSLVVAPGAATQLDVRCRPLRHQPHAATLTVTSNAPGPAPTTLVRCSGLAPAITVSAVPAWELGDVTVGTTATAQVFVHNPSANLGTALSWSVPLLSPPFSLSCISGCTCTGSACSGTTTSPGAQLRVTFTPVTTGPFTASLPFTSNDPDRPLVTHDASGRGIPVVIAEPVEELPPGDPPEKP